MIEGLSKISSVERFLYSHSKLQGVNFQPEDNILAYIASYSVHQIPAILTKPQLTGALPKEGAGLVVANHTCWKDIFLMYWLPMVTADRTLRLVAKAKLLDPDLSESEVTVSRRRQSTTKKIIYTLGLDKPLSMLHRHVLAPYLRTFRPIPISLGDNGFTMARSAMQQIAGEFEKGNLVGVFPTATRKPPLDLLDTVPLAALLAQLNPNIPVIPVGISGLDGFFPEILKPPIINIGEVITYRGILQEKDPQKELGRKGDREIMSRAVADRIGALVADPRLYPAWWLERHGVFSEQQLRLMNKAGQNLYRVYLAAQKD